MPDICNTDIKKAVKYLSDAAALYDTMPGRRNECRAWVIRHLIKKINKKVQL